MTEKRETDNAFNLNNLDDLDQSESIVPADNADSEAPPWADSETSQSDALPFDSSYDPEVFTDPADETRKEPVVIADREPDLFGEEPAEISEPLYRESDRSSLSDETTALPTSEASENSDRKMPWSSALSIAAILLSSVAILLNLTASTPTASVTDQELAAFEQQARTSEARYLELKQQLSRRLSTLEAAQEQTHDSLQMVLQRMNSRPAKTVAAPAVTKVKKPTVTEPFAPITSSGWAVNLLSVDDKAIAAKEKQRLNSLGIAAEVAPFYINKVVKYRVRVGGFANRDEAAKYKEKLAAEYGIKDAWIYKP